MFRRLRVLTIGHSYVVGINRALIRAVANYPEFEITVAAPTSFRGDFRMLTLEPEPEGSRLRVVGVPTKWSRWIHCFQYDRRVLDRLLAEQRFDVVHAWEEPFIFAGHQIARALNGNPARFCFRTAQSLSKIMPPPFRGFERRTLARAQGWIAGGSLVYQAMLSRGYPQDLGRVLTLAVDTSVFRPLNEASRCAAIAELGLKPPIIGFVGRLHRDKGINVLLQSMNLIANRTPWSLLFLGTGPMQSHIERWAVEKGWTDRVQVRLAKHDDVPRYLAAMDVLAAPSQTTWHWKEQFGRMIIEAFACGVPVVGSDSGEIPFVIGDAGRVLPERDARQWADVIQQLLQNPSQRAELTEKGLQRCRNYSVTTMAERYREYYHWLAEQPIRQLK